MVGILVGDVVLALGCAPIDWPVVVDAGVVGTDAVESSRSVWANERLRPKPGSETLPTSTSTST